MAERTSNFKNISRRVSDKQWENATDMITLRNDVKKSCLGVTLKFRDVYGMLV